MSFMVPDDFLENYICSECDKFLSVNPIKIYPNRQIKCGRCAKQEDAATNSSLQMFAEIALFKCINRFDGCRVLLTSDQVEDHEQNCLSKEYLCPICPQSTEFPPFKIVQHFKQYHGKNILQKPYLDINIGETLEFKKIFMYRLNDYLFFITIKSEMISDNVSFEISLFGKAGMTNMFLKLSIRSGDNVIENSKNFLPIEGNTQIFVFPKSIFDNDKLFVTFEFNLGKPLIGKIEKNNLGEPIIGKIEKNKSTDLPLLPFQRKLDIDKTLQDSSILNISKSGKVIISVTIIPFCLLCSEVFKGSTNCYKQNCVWSTLKETVQYVCSNCLIYFSTVLKKTFDLVPLEFDVFKCILYFCTWNCDLPLSNNELLIHEMRCNLQPIQQCPVDGCQFNGKLFEIKRHFDITHENNTTVLNIGESVIENVQDINFTKYFWINGYFVLTSHTCSSLNEMPPHTYFCIHNIQTTFCKDVPEDFKLLCFSIFKQTAKIPAISSISRNYTHVDGDICCYGDGLDHSICKNKNIKYKICVVPK